MQTTRTLTVSKHQKDGSSVVYVMSRDQRVKDNFALLAAQQHATKQKLPLLVLFTLFTESQHRYREHFEFMLDGLQEVQKDLAGKDIKFILRTGQSDKEIMKFLKEVDAESVYFDFSPLHGRRELVKQIGKTFDGAVTVVDAHNIIPVWVTSDKQEFAAHTIRRKVHAHLEKYLIEPDKVKKHPVSYHHSVNSLSFTDAKKQVAKMPSNGTKLEFIAGEKAAHKQLQTFIEKKLANYANKRNDPGLDQLSDLSPYFHYGQLASLRVALAMMDEVKNPPLLLSQARMAQAGSDPSEEDGMNALMEEMIVRKELSDNFCFYGPAYKSLKGAPEWAMKSLDKHRKDDRDFTYSQDEWEAAKTHDEAWNACQNQMMQTGKMHGYMRMYWAKKLLEWSKSPEEALSIANYLNDKYEIDGGDPNGYVGMLWSIAGLHDRPWTERPVFGQVRYMNAGGLKRKFDVAAYIAQWNSK